MDGLVAVGWWLLDGKHRCVAAGLRQWGHVCVRGRFGGWDYVAIDFCKGDAEVKMTQLRPETLVRGGRRRRREKDEPRVVGMEGVLCWCC